MPVVERTAREFAAIAASTILVVDDDTSIRDAIAEFLGGHRNEVRTAASAAAWRSCMAWACPGSIWPMRR